MPEHVQVELTLDQVVRKQAEVIKKLAMLCESMAGRLSATERQLSALTQATANAAKVRTREFAEYKVEVGKALERVDDKVSGVIADLNQAMPQLAGMDQMMIAGLHRTEYRLNLWWNTFNGFIRFIENVFQGVHPPPGEPEADGHYTRSSHPYWTRDRFVVHLLAAGKETYDEAMAYEKSELARMRAEKQVHGKVLTPMMPRQADAAGEFTAFNEHLLKRGTEDHGAELAELRELRKEGNARLASAVAAMKNRNGGD